MKAIKITDTDSTCVEAGWNSNTEVGEFAAVPDWVEGDSACFIARKHGSNLIKVGELRLRAFVDETKSVAIEEAHADMEFDGVCETDKEWWTAND